MSAWSVWVLLGGIALADPATHHAWFDKSRRAEAQGRFEEAVQACRASIAAWPSGPRGAACERLTQRLERRRDADGGFAGLIRLHDVRFRHRDADPSTLRDEIRALYSLGSLSPVLRAELEIWLASDALQRLQRPSDALPYTTAAYDRLDQLDQEEPLRRRVVELHALALARLGQLEQAREVEDAIRLPTLAPRPTPVQRVAIEAQRLRLATIAAGVLATGLVLATPLAVATVRARPRAIPLGVLALSVPIGGAGLLSEGWSHGAGAAIPWLWLGATGIHLLSALALIRLASAPPLLRSVARLVALSATLAVGYLALYLTESLAWVGG
ncbi:MAG TPA: hypothetical protein ENK18_07110 [Deltaproteobacteria bacterium]|nr:hypothetical protein [Deltaproteobacteria bacterium]